MNLSKFVFPTLASPLSPHFRKVQREIRHNELAMQVVVATDITSSLEDIPMCIP